MCLAWRCIAAKLVQIGRFQVMGLAYLKRRYKEAFVDVLY